MQVFTTSMAASASPQISSKATPISAAPLPVTPVNYGKSTLTEEQKEQLAAGTLVAPANVSLPGDGEFARQWWYDQQVQEDQALIDSGELDYPEHLQAANFTDTFALGDNTNIKLASSGTSEFKNDIRVDTDPSDATTSFALLSRGQASILSEIMTIP